MMDDFGNSLPEDVTRFRNAAVLVALIKRSVNEIMDEREARYAISPEVHQKHHQLWEAYLKERARKRERRAEIRKKVTDTVVGTVTIAIVGGTITAISGLGRHVLDWLAAALRTNGS